MKVFVTGASGFIGSAIVRELLSAGHQVSGLARSEASAEMIKAAGAKVVSGGLEDLDILQQAATAADGIIHTAFIHDFTQYARANEVEKSCIAAMGDVLKGTEKPFVITAGILGLPTTNGFITEDDGTNGSPRSSEAAAMTLADEEVHACVIRLAPSVHDTGDKGFVPFIISQARKNGVSAYVGSGNNHWPAIHRLDAAVLYRLALEKGERGARYNGVTDKGIRIIEIASMIGTRLQLPVKAVDDAGALQHFEWMSRFIAFDSPATSFKTQEALGWKPQQMSLLEDMEQNYF